MTADSPSMRSRGLSVLVRCLLVGVDQFFAAVVDDRDSQDHEGDGQDELQAFDEERPVTRCNLDDQGIGRFDESRHGDAEHDDHGDVEHEALAARRLEEDGQADEDHGGQQLVGRTKERPDVHVAAQAEQEAEEQGDDRSKIFVDADFLDGIHFLSFIDAEQFLEGHTADTADGIKGRQGQGRNAHGHDAGSRRLGQAEHGEETSDSAGENLERRPRSDVAVGSGSAGDDQGDDA